MTKNNCLRNISYDPKIKIRTAPLGKWMLKNLVLLYGGCAPNRFLLPLSAILPKQETRRRIANPNRRAVTDEACNMTIMSRTPYWYNLSGSLISLTTADGAENCPIKRVSRVSLH
jgi:hypothetical protein